MFNIFKLFYIKKAINENAQNEIKSTPAAILKDKEITGKYVFRLFFNIIENRA